MKKLKLMIATATVTFGLVACNATMNDSAAPVDGETTAAVETTAESSRGMGMGPGSSMMARHRAPIPSEYAGITNPIPADDESLVRGEETYVTNCATCHGDGGMGDGPAAVGLDPAPAAIAHSSQMMGDDYLFYRISEGGAFDPFNSAMPSWKSALDESARWDVINYVRALGSGQVMPGQQMGGMMFDPEAEALKHAQIASQGVEQGVITQEEADVFLAVHAELDALMAGNMERTGSMDDMQETMLSELIEDGRINQEQADTFTRVHDGLMAAGLME